MDYKVKITDFEGPLDLLLHLIKESSIDIFEIQVEEITKQYLDYIAMMEKMNIDIASEYLVMAAELIEMKSRVLLPNSKNEEDDEYEEDPREQLIERLLEYKKYKEVVEELKKLEQERKTYFTKEESDLSDYQEKSKLPGDVTLNDLIQAFQKFMEEKAKEKPLSTKVTTKEYSVHVRSNEIRAILKKKKKVSFEELFEVVTKSYVVVTFLSVLSLVKKNEIDLVQENNFSKIYLTRKEV